MPVIRFVQQKKLENSSPFDYRYGFWGNVTEVDSSKCRVKVMADTGREIIGLPVASMEYVNKTDNYVSGSRNLPAVGSRVFVLMPTGTITGAFVLCSGFAIGEAETHTFYANESEKNEKNSIKEVVTQGGWKEYENFKTGVKEFESNNGEISIKVDPENEVKIVAWNHTIKINKDGINLSDTSEVIINSDKNITVKGKNVEFSVDKFTVTNGSEFPLLEVN